MEEEGSRRNRRTSQTKKPEFTDVSDKKLQSVKNLFKDPFFIANITDPQVRQNFAPIGSASWQQAMIGLDTSKDASLRLFNTWADTKLVQLFDDVKSDTYKGTSEIWLDNWHLIQNLTFFIPVPFLRWDHLLISIFIRRGAYNLKQNEVTCYYRPILGWLMLWYHPDGLLKDVVIDEIITRESLWLHLQSNQQLLDNVVRLGIQSMDQLREMKDIYDTYQSLFLSFISKLGTPLSHCQDMQGFDDIAKNMFTGDYDRTSSIVFYLGDLGDQDVAEAIQDEVDDDSIDFYRKSEDLRLQQLSLFLEAVQFDEGDTLDPIRTLQLLHKYGSFKIGADLSKSKRSSSIRKQSIGQKKLDQLSLKGMKDVSPKKDTIAKNLKKKKTTIPVPSKPTKKGNSNSIQLSQRQSSLPRNEVPNNTTIQQQQTGNANGNGYIKFVQELPENFTALTQFTKHQADTITDAMAKYETFSQPDFDSLDQIYSKEIVGRIFEDAFADQKLIVARYFFGIADESDPERTELLKIHDSRLQNIIKKNMEGQAQGGSRVPEMLDGEEPKINEEDEDEEYNDVEGIDSDYDGNHRKYGSFQKDRETRYVALYTKPKAGDSKEHNFGNVTKLKGRQVGQYGILPDKAWDAIKKAADGKIGIQQRGLLRTVYGGAMAPFREKVANVAKEDIDDQYAQVVKAIESQLGTRTNSSVWQGRLMAQKAIWDLWIDYVKNVLLAGVKGEQEKWDFKPHTIGQGDQALLKLTTNLVDMQIYLKGNMNLNDDEKITLMVNLKTSVAKEFSSKQSAEQERDDILKAHPNYIGKLQVLADGTGTYGIFLKLRVYMKNTSELKWRPTAKYGPFDVLYTKVGTFKKNYIDASVLKGAETFDEIEKGQDSLFYDKIGLEMEIQMKETTHDNGFLYGKETFKFDQFVLVGDHRTLMGLTGLINNASFSRLKNYPIYLLFLKLNFTLAKWFYGKKSALQKINQERVQNYLRKDTSDLKKVMHFFGGNTDFIDRRR